MRWPLAAGLAFVLAGCASRTSPPAWPAVTVAFTVTASGVVVHPLLVSGLDSLAVAQTLEFPLPEGILRGTVNRRDTPAEGTISWSGPLTDGQGYFTLLRDGSGQLLKITVPDRVDVIIADTQGRGTLTQIDPATVPEGCNAALLPMSSPSVALPSNALSAGVAAIVSQPCSGNPSPSLAVIDVMVGYSAAARQAAGGTRPIELMIKAFIDETNQAMQNSFTGVRLQVAKRPAGNPTMIRPRPAGPPFRETRFTIPSNLCISEVVYAETGDVHKDLDALIDSQDGILDAAHTARDLCKADISVLILEDVGYFGGKAWIPPIPDVRFAPWAFAVVRRDSAIANTAFSHEVGHLFGGGHDVQNGGPAMCPYSAGWRLQAGVVRYRTVMAYKCATYPCSGAVPILFFSDPNILFGGVAVGSVNAQNARTIRIAAPTVSMYR